MKTYDFPGFIDVHVHFRDPGVPEAETTASGLEAARRGGFAAVVTMPNTTPACDSPEIIRYQEEREREFKSSTVQLLPSACITKGRLGREVADLEALAKAGAAFFTDDGSYVADDKVMEEAMRRAASLGMCICEHAMDPKEVKERSRYAAIFPSAASRVAGCTSSISRRRRGWSLCAPRRRRVFP